MENHLESVGASEPVSARGVCSLSPKRSVLRAPWSAPSTPFVAATEWLESGMPVVSVIGELDLATAPVLEEALATLAENGEGTVMVDLGRCGFIDLRGLHVLLAARAGLEHSGRLLVLIAGNPDLLRVFNVTRVDGLFAIYPSRTAAAQDAAHGG